MSTLILTAQKMPQGGRLDVPDDPGFAPYPFTKDSMAFLGLMGAYHENALRDSLWQLNARLIDAYTAVFANWLISYEAGRAPNTPPVPPLGWRLYATRIVEANGNAWGNTLYAPQQDGPAVCGMPAYAKLPAATAPIDPDAQPYEIGQARNSAAPTVDGVPVGYEMDDPATGYRWGKGVGRTPFGLSYFWLRIS